MKTSDMYRLHEDLVRVVKQIGILPEEVPRLVTDRDEMHYLKLHNIRFVRTGNESIDKRTAGYGECSTFASYTTSYS
jgi:hypothetical protein